MASNSPDEVEDIFFEEFTSILPPELRDFADYLVDNYMTFESTYPPTLWASSNVEDRTTNACESFHAKFNKLFLEAHPNIFVFL